MKDRSRIANPIVGRYYDRVTDDAATSVDAADETFKNKISLEKQ